MYPILYIFVKKLFFNISVLRSLYNNEGLIDLIIKTIQFNNSMVLVRISCCFIALRLLFVWYWFFLVEDCLIVMSIVYIGFICLKFIYMVWCSYYPRFWQLILCFFVLLLIMVLGFIHSISNWLQDNEKLIFSVLIDS